MVESIVARLDEVERRTHQVILPKSDFGKALQYFRSNFAELTRYLSNGHLPIDDNLAEQLMRQFGVGRKNCLFSGSLAGGQREAGFYTLVSIALRSDLEVWFYVKDVLDQLLAGRADYEPLLNWNWGVAHLEAIRHYRIEERTTHRTHQQTKRATRPRC